MQASMEYPVYTAKLFTSDGTKYRLKEVTTDLVAGQAKDDLAEKVSLTVTDVKVGKKALHSMISLKNSLYLYANTGSGAKEVFRGFVWERQFDTTADSKEVKLVCYDRLIYLQNSKDNLFVAKGSLTEDIITKLANKWGIKIKYSYESIKHKKTVFRSDNISDIIITLLEEVKKKTGKDYVIRCEKGVMLIEHAGANKTVYKVQDKDNSASVSYNETMDGMVTKVKIIKPETVKKKETGKYVTVADVKGNTKKYGTLQDIIEKSSGDKMADVKKEAQQIIKKDGSPKKDITVTAIDNPWIKKGYKVYVNTGGLKGDYIVKGIEHDAMSHLMTLEVEKA